MASRCWGRPVITDHSSPVVIPRPSQAKWAAPLWRWNHFVRQANPPTLSLGFPIELEKSIFPIAVGKMGKYNSMVSCIHMRISVRGGGGEGYTQYQRKPRIFSILYSVKITHFTVFWALTFKTLKNCFGGMSLSIVLLMITDQLPCLAGRSFDNLLWTIWVCYQWEAGLLMQFGVRFADNFYFRMVRKERLNL